MSHRWMFEVLSDLETYARCNGLPQLANRLSLAAGQAAHELAAAQRAERGEPPLLLSQRAE